MHRLLLVLFKGLFCATGGEPSNQRNPSYSEHDASFDCRSNDAREQYPIPGWTYTVQEKVDGTCHFVGAGPLRGIRSGKDACANFLVETRFMWERE